MTLREGNREYFYSKLDKHFPGLKEKYQKKYGFDYQIVSGNNGKLNKMFYDVCGKYGISCNNDILFEYMRTFEDKKGQMELF